MIPPLILLELRLRALAPIRKLPHFHGALWSALLRNLLREHLPEGSSPAETGVALQTVETGIPAYEKGEPIHLGLSFPMEAAPGIAVVLEAFNASQCGQGHFQPGRTVALETVRCRVSGAEWDAANLHPLSAEIIAPEAERLTALTAFTLELCSPLRLTRPAGTKDEQHRYVDEAYLFAPPGRDEPTPLKALLQRVRIPGVEGAGVGELNIAGGAVAWLDVPYGNPQGKTLGGIVGRLRIAGTPLPETARLLVAGQYCGAGKNGAFGLGFVAIPELASVRRVAPLTRGQTLLERAMRPDSLAAALGRLSNSSPGPDGLTIADLRSAGDPFFKELSRQARNGPIQEGEMKKYRVPKDNGGERIIFVQNAAERLVHRALADRLAPAIENLLSSSSYAYRQGLNRKSAANTLKKMMSEGYSSGIKADIEAFFDSVCCHDMTDLLAAYFPAEPAVDLIGHWLLSAQAAGAGGLPQGGILSPILSNLYLDRFDRRMAEEGFRLVRYCDDLVVLFKEGQTAGGGEKIVREALARLGLCLKEEKTEELVFEKPVRFLGLLVSADEVSEIEREEQGRPSEADWLPLFREDWNTGQPVYLTILTKGACSKGADLIIQGEKDEKVASIPWNRVSRLVVVGRARFSGGLVYRAMRENIPMSFIDIMGRLSGQFHAPEQLSSGLAALQREKAGDPAFALSFAREIVAAKILNSQTILRRNDVPRPKLNELAARAREAIDMDQLRGFEGAAAALYFEALGSLTAPFAFKKRVYRPPDSPVNVMLSFGYTLLYNRISGALREKGFDPRIGFFHQGRGSHHALASDLQEELRHLVERVTLSLIHLGEIAEKDFDFRTIKGERMCRMGGDAFRAFIRRFEHSMARKFNFGSKGQISYNTYLDEMAEALRRSLKLGISYQALRIR